MKITREVRDFAARQNAGVEMFVAAEAKAGMAAMSVMFREKVGRFTCSQGMSENHFS